MVEQGRKRDRSENGAAIQTTVSTYFTGGQLEDTARRSDVLKEGGFISQKGGYNFYGGWRVRRDPSVVCQ